MNKVTHSTVAVDFDTASGYGARESFGHGENGSKALRDGLREIARILTINGEGDEAVRLVAEAKAAVEADRAREPA